ncbi:MAG TPA: acyltransferase [Spongiibacteraceae bacterium]|nr:acyltransferase [Spongiibacteraceae bacterium]
MRAKRNTDIEVLRAVAIVTALVQHFPLLIGHSVPALNKVGHYFGFWGGVDLFCAISGYVITRSLSTYMAAVAGRGNWSLELKTFAIRRVFRLLPSAWLWLAIPLLLSAIVKPDTYPPARTLANDVLAAAFSVANFYWYQCGATGSMGRVCSDVVILLPYWTLSLEEQFYFLLPIVLLLVPRRWLMPLILLVLAALLTWTRPLFSLGWFIRIDGLLWGVLLALLSTGSHYALGEPRFLRNSRWRPLALIGLVALICAIPRVLGNYTFEIFGAPSPMTIGVLAMSCGLCVYVASFDKDYLFAAGPLKDAVVALGVRSYAIYLVHLPCFELARSICHQLAPSTELSGLRLVLTAVPLVVIAAELTHRFVEIPTRNLGRGVAQRLRDSRSPVLPETSS